MRKSYGNRAIGKKPIARYVDPRNARKGLRFETVCKLGHPCLNGRMKTDFIKGGFHHIQIKREGGVAMFARTKNGRTHFEVVRPISAPAYELAGIKFPAGEHYPSSETWGQRGWTYVDREDADTKFNALTN